MEHRPTLVILPGWDGNHKTWQEFIHIASRFFVVTCLDLPCFGNEPCPDTLWGVEEYANFVYKKISRLPNKPLLLLGHSFGGQVAVCLTVKHPELIDRLILSGAAIIRPARRCRRIIFGALAWLGRLIFHPPISKRFNQSAQKLLYRLARSPDYPKTDGVKRDIYKKIIRQDYRHVLPQIMLPTLVVWGGKDRLTPLRYGRAIVKRLPRATFHVFPHAHHGLHQQMPKALMSVIHNFMNK